MKEIFSSEPYSEMLKIQKELNHKLWTGKSLPWEGIDKYV